MKYPINSFTLLLFSPSLISQSVCFSFSLWSLHTFRLFFSFWVFSFAFSFTCSHAFFNLFIYSWFSSYKHTHTHSLSLSGEQRPLCVSWQEGGSRVWDKLLACPGSQSLWKIHRSHRGPSCLWRFSESQVWATGNQTCLSKPQTLLRWWNFQVAAKSGWDESRKLISLHSALPFENEFTGRRYLAWVFSD